MMGLSINQDNLYLLLSSKVSWLTCFLAEDENVSIVEALKKFMLLNSIGICRKNIQKNGIWGQSLYTKNWKNK